MTTSKILLKILIGMRMINSGFQSRDTMKKLMFMLVQDSFSVVALSCLQMLPKRINKEMEDRSQTMIQLCQNQSEDSNSH